LATDIVAWDVPELPDVRGTLVGLNKAVMPAAAEYERSTVPANWLILVRVTVDAPDEP
jgi:hypothetical protein